MNRIRSNEQVTGDIFKMILEGDTSEIKAPGQFINIKIEGLYLRRPISISDWTEDTMTILYKVVGKGTKCLSAMGQGEALDLLYPLGNGFSIGNGANALVIGGGIGIPPLYGLTKQLIRAGVKPKVILGFAGARDVFYEKAFADLDVEVSVTTEDGSYGTKGFVTDAYEEAEYVYACGPEAMLQAVSRKAADGQFSFEARMGCGFGACMGCSCKTKSGAKRICVEGPVLEKEDILW